MLCCKSCRLCDSTQGCHIIFNRLEPAKLLAHTFLLLGIPGILTSFLARPNHNIVMAAATIYTLYLSILSISVICYRLSPFHPLARYPGPFLSKISMLWLVRVSLGGKEHICHQKLHEQYGEIVRIGKWLFFLVVERILRLVLIRPQLSICPWPSGNHPHDGYYWRAERTLWVLLSWSENIVVDFLESVSGARDPKHGWKSMIALRDPVEHARRRKPWNRGFNTEALKGYEEIIETRATQLLDQLAKQDGVVDLAKWLSYFT